MYPGKKNCNDKSHGKPVAMILVKNPSKYMVKKHGQEKSYKIMFNKHLKTTGYQIQIAV